MSIITKADDLVAKIGKKEAIKYYEKEIADFIVVRCLDDAIAKAALITALKHIKGEIKYKNE